MALRLDDKARESLQAAERLLQDDERECLPNSVANRAYYAAYLATAHVAQQRGLPFTGTDDYYRHDSFPDDASRVRVLDKNGVRDLRMLRDMRVMADYYEDSVEFEQANLAYETAARLVKELLQ